MCLLTQPCAAVAEFLAQGAASRPSLGAVRTAADLGTDVRDDAEADDLAALQLVRNRAQEGITQIGIERPRFAAAGRLRLWQIAHDFAVARCVASHVTTNGRDVAAHRAGIAIAATAIAPHARARWLQQTGGAARQAAAVSAAPAQG
jgi:hypothetical protein